MPDVDDVSRSRKVPLPKLVKRDGHNPVCRKESLLHAIAVVHININIKYPDELGKEEEGRCQYSLTKSGCFLLRHKLILPDTTHKYNKTHNLSIYCIPLVVLEKFQDAKHNIVHVAETRRLKLLSVM